MFMTAIALATVPPPVAEPRWMLVRQGSTSDFYIDLGSRREMERGIVRAWVRNQFDPSRVVDGITYHLTMARFDCRQDRYAFIELHLYKDDGQSLGSKPSGGTWSYVVPGTPAEDLLRAACRQD